MLLLCALIWLCHCAAFAQSPAAQEEQPQTKVTLFRSTKTPDSTLPNIHPELVREGDRKYDQIILSIQEGELLKMALFTSDLKKWGFRLDVHNPSKRDFAYMPARLLPKDEVLFADGTVFKPYLPPDAKIVGGSDWSRDIRWKRVYKNYHYLTMYKGTHAIHYDGLVTEKNGRDLYLLFGESSASSTRKRLAGGIGAGRGISTYHDLLHMNFIDDDGKYREVDIVRVDEQDLPPDFPKGLVRWIP